MDQGSGEFGHRRGVLRMYSHIRRRVGALTAPSLWKTKTFCLCRDLVQPSWPLTPLMGSRLILRLGNRAFLVWPSQESLRKSRSAPSLPRSVREESPKEEEGARWSSRPIGQAVREPARLGVSLLPKIVAPLAALAY